MKELKPCPFCGCEAVLAVDERFCRSGDILNQIMIQCTKCGAIMEGDTYQFNKRIFDERAKNQVIEAWNTRVGEANE